MSAGSSVQVVRDIQTLFDAGTASGLSDRQLLERFSGGPDASAEAAFEAIVQRHGPMVLRLCHKQLGNQADAEEAFQATFLILVKKCRSIRQLDTVGGWLFGVASRVAARAQVERARRRSAEQTGGLRIATAADLGGEGIDRDELGAAIEAEVLRLPEKYRAVVVLCYWDGLTHEQAADRLGCPLGTVRSRMARARSLLHRRLSRRGLEPVAGIMAAAFDSPAMLKVSALEIPSALMSSTVGLATKVAAGGSVARLTSASIATLVQKVIGSMFMTKLKTLAVFLVLIGVGAYGLTLAAAQVERVRRNAPERVQRAATPKSKAQPPLSLMPDYIVGPPDLLLVEVLEALPGRPISGERLVRPDGRISLGFYGDLYVAGLTLTEVKEKIVLHLKKYLSDENLGLIELDEAEDDVAEAPPKPGKPEGPRSPFDLDGESGRRIDPDDDRQSSGRARKAPVVSDGEQVRRVHPKETNRVFVDVTAYNSKNYYVEGDVLVPGKLPVTGADRVLDAISYAGGLLPEADHEQVFLYRQTGAGEPVKTLRIDIDQIMMGDDLSTNYQILPGDKLVVRRRKDVVQAITDAKRQSSPPNSKSEGPSAYFNRREVANPSREDLAEGQTKRSSETTLRSLETRMGEVERKLDLILERLDRPAR